MSLSKWQLLFKWSFDFDGFIGGVTPSFILTASQYEIIPSGGSQGKPSRVQASCDRILWTSGAVLASITSFPEGNEYMLASKKRGYKGEKDAV